MAVLLQLVGLLALEPQPRPYTEVDYYRDFANFMTLAGKEESVVVSGGAGHVREGFASVDVSYRRKTLFSAFDLLPTTIGASLWASPGGDDHLGVTASLGYTLVLGLFDGPYMTANALGQWSPTSSAFDLGFDTGVGWEWRRSMSLSITADLRFVKLWSVTDDVMSRETAPWGGRFTVGVRRYLDL